MPKTKNQTLVKIAKSSRKRRLAPRDVMPGFVSPEFHNPYSDEVLKVSIERLAELVGRSPESVLSSVHNGLQRAWIGENGDVKITRSALQVWRACNPNHMLPLIDDPDREVKLPLSELCTDLDDLREALDSRMIQGRIVGRNFICPASEARYIRQRFFDGEGITFI